VAVGWLGALAIWEKFSGPIRSRIDPLFGDVLEMPIFPRLPTNNLDLRPASPPTDDCKLKVPPFNTLYVVAGLAPVGEERDRLPDILAVGFPDPTFINANLALDVAELPMSTSNESVSGDRAPLIMRHQLMPEPLPIEVHVVPLQ